MTEGAAVLSTFLGLLVGLALGVISADPTIMAAIGRSARRARRAALPRARAMKIGPWAPPPPELPTNGMRQSTAPGFMLSDGSVVPRRGVTTAQVTALHLRILRLQDEIVRLRARVADKS